MEEIRLTAGAIRRELEDHYRGEVPQRYLDALELLDAVESANPPSPDQVERARTAFETVLRPWLQDRPVIRWNVRG
jgi:hypothetical protein